MSRLKLGSTITLLASAIALTSMTGCLDHPLKPVELEKGSEVEDQLQLTVNKDVDILFVIDNSGSMGEEQANLGANFPTFIGVLEAEDVEANYRIGITTTDNGNPWCPAAQTTPEAGKLVLSSCKTRLGDFLFGNDVDVQDLACNDICNLEAADLEILPTITDSDKNPAPRPWLENIEGKKNIPAGTPMADAFACFGPQGVNGCGFEQPLEGMYLALTRAQTNSEASYGFLRASAILAIVFVTDEADCSHNKMYSEIFSADGNKVFWSDPTAAYPTSAVCWYAGVDCEGDPSGYTACHAVNKDVNGNSGVSDGQAVLHPMSRYIGLVQGIEDQKKEINAQQEVIVALIGGVASDGQAYYSDVTNTDPGFQDSFGIGPGCTAPNPLDPEEPVEAIPPVRLRDMVDAFTPDNMFSICDADYSPALLAIANRIKDQIQPACYTKCVKDTDAATELVEPECTVEENPPGNGTEDVVRVQECLRGADGAYVIDPTTNDYTMPADDINVCYAMLTDSNMSTPSTADDMSEECTDRNFNLEFKIARRPGFPAEGGTAISATCSLADFPEITCPGIGG
ncbi:MAG: hypothetical protein R6X02_01145 [Enhygromyxa sp.]